MSKPYFVDKKSQRRLNCNKNNSAHYHKRRQQPDCFQYRRLKGLKRDGGQA